MVYWELFGIKVGLEFSGALQSTWMAFYTNHDLEYNNWLKAEKKSPTANQTSNTPMLYQQLSLTLLSQSERNTSSYKVDS